MLSMMNVMYHLSFEKEESRNISATIAYMEPSDNLSGILNRSSPPIRFENIIRFSKSELIRLSPAFNPKTSILTVCAEEKIIEGGSPNQLVIWGVIFLGNDYTNLKNGRASGALSPPFIFTLEVSEPGELLASASGEQFFKLKGGQLTNSPLKDISEGIIGNHFSNITNKLYLEVCEGLQRDRYSEDDSNDTPKTLYFSTLRNILRLIEKKRHGGTLIVVPESLPNEVFRDSLHMKYQLKSPKIWDEFLNKCINERLYFDVLFKKGKDIQEYEQILDSKRRIGRAEKKIFEHEEFISSLSEVDGAVVLNEKFEILGFGAEIRLTNDELTSIKKANDPYGNDTTNLNIISYGTRHRSAIRYCNYNKDAIAFVISQDGKVKSIKQHEGVTYLWDGINLEP
ncbi:hypothetical protein COC96_26370 [Bacillus cereus]|nr:hypothetical protein COC96_26370 [Bacillus cereus]